MDEDALGGILAALQGGATDLGDVGVDRSDWVHMVQMQQMVRVTCLEVMGAAPSKIADFKAEVIKLQQVIQGFRDDLEQIKMRPPPSICTTGSEPSTPQTVDAADDASIGSPAPLLMLQLAFESEPKAVWYENRPLPPFSVSLTQPSGEPYTNDDITLMVSLRNGRGQIEERKANGEGELLGGTRVAQAVGGSACWDNLLVCEPSSRHYGSFRLVVTAASAPPSVGVAELASEPVAVQVGRMWSKRRKEELEPTDPISQISGVGKQYVTRLAVHGIDSIAQFAALAASEEGRTTICRICKGDNPRCSLNQATLQSWIEKAREVVREAAAREIGSPPQEKRSREGADEAHSEARKAHKAQKAGEAPVEFECPLLHIPMDELTMLAFDEAAEEERAAHETPHAPFSSTNNFADDVEPDVERLTRRLQLDDSRGAALTSIQIVAPKGAAVGMGAFDDFEDSPTSEAGGKPHGATTLATASGDRRLHSVGSVCVHFGCSPLHIAAAAAAPAALGHVIQRRAPLDSRAPQLGGATPLMVAACCGPRAAPAALELLRAGASPSVSMLGQLQAAHLASWAGSTELLAWLRAEGHTKLLCAPSHSGLRPVHYAALGAQPAALRLLLEVDGGGGSWVPLLHAAAIGGDPDCVAVVLNMQSAARDATWNDGWSPLITAAASGASGAVAALLAAGFEANASSADGVTALHVASAFGHADCVRVLLQGGAAVGAATADFGCTPIMLAAFSGDRECVEMLQRAGASGAAMLHEMVVLLHGEEEGAPVAALLQ